MEPIVDMNKITVAFSSPFPIEFGQLQERLSEHGYSQPTDKAQRFRFLESGQAIPISVLSKDSFELAYDEQRGFLSIESEEFSDELGAELENVIESVNDLPNLAAELNWYELHLVCRVLGSKHPLDNIVAPSKAHSLFKKISGLDPRYFSRSYCSFSGDLPSKPLNQVVDWIHITMGVFVPNPKYYQMRFICRRGDLAKVIEFYKALPNMIREFSASDVWE